MSNIFFPLVDGQGRPIQLVVQKRAPQFQTDVQRSLGGAEFRVSRLPIPRWRWSVSLPILPDASANDALGTIIAFFMARGGQLDTFLWSPPEDADTLAHAFLGSWCRQTGVQIGVGDGLTTTFPLVRPWGGTTWPYAASEPVQWVDTRNNALVVKDNGSVASGITMGTDGATGGVTVTFPTAPVSGHAITADFDVAYRVRFTTDVAQLEWLAWRLWKGFSFDLEQVFA